MGLQCSILGHSFESAGVEREREEQDSEVVTTEREIERCRRCGTERVVSESTEVTAIVDGEAVDLGDETDSKRPSDDTRGTDTASRSGGGPENAPSSTSEESPTGDAFGGIVDRSEVEDGDGESTDDPSPADGASSTDTGGEILEGGSDADGSPLDANGPAPSATVAEDDPLADDPNPTEEDAEILTDDDSEREPGEWPDDSGLGEGNAEPADAREPTPEPDDSNATESEPAVDVAADESLSGITVPEGEIVCSDCGFRVDAQSGYRAGDPCPDCAAWLEAERNQ